MQTANAHSVPARIGSGSDLLRIERTKIATAQQNPPIGPRISNAPIPECKRENPTIWGPSRTLSAVCSQTSRTVRIAVSKSHISPLQGNLETNGSCSVDFPRFVSPTTGRAVTPACWHVAARAEVLSAAQLDRTAVALVGQYSHR
jgi:hypothetical protein